MCLSPSFLTPSPDFVRMKSVHVGKNVTCFNVEALFFILSDDFEIKSKIYGLIHSSCFNSYLEFQLDDFSEFVSFCIMVWKQWLQ
jgi:hypothetical protein